MVSSTRASDRRGTYSPVAMGTNSKQTIRTYRKPASSRPDTESTRNLSAYSGTLALPRRSDFSRIQPVRKIKRESKMPAIRRSTGLKRIPRPRKRSTIRAASAETRRVDPIDLTRATMILPLFFSGLVLLTALASGTLDGIILNTGPAEVAFFPGDLQPAEAVVVLKASVNAITAGNSYSELVFTRHRVNRHETVSRIAYDHGLSATTLISVNELNSAPHGDIKTGTVLIVPYRDGFRVSPGLDEGPEELAVRYGTSPEMIQLIPGTGDFFVTGNAVSGIAVDSDDGESFRYPVSGRIITAYGLGMDSLTGIPYESDGIDLAAQEGTPITSSRNGSVIFTGHHASYGLYVMVSHSGGWKSFYGHMSRIDVAPGDSVDTSSVLGVVGSSGTARSARLHFALFNGGESVDPLDYLF